MIHALRVPQGNVYTHNNTEPTPPPPQEPPQEPTSELFSQSVDRIADFMARAEAGEQGLEENLRAASSATKEEFKTVMTSQTELPATLEQARALTLGAIQAGLMAGAMDGAILLAVDSTMDPPPSNGPSGVPDWDEFMNDLGEMWDSAKETMGRVGVGVLKGASRQSKNVTAKVYQQADLFVGNENVPVEGFQAYLAGAFAAGYSIAGMDSLLVMEGQVPPEELK